MKLTQASIAGLELDSDKSEQRFFDDDLTGFALRVRAGGKRTWIIQYRNAAGKSTTKNLGSCKTLSLTQARQLAKRDLANVTLGSNPQKEKSAARIRAAETLGSFATKFLDHQRDRLKPRSFQQVDTHLTKHWAPLTSLSVHDITRRNIAVRLSEIAAERGAFAANRARATLSKFFTWAMKEGVAETNPVVGTNRQADEQARDRVLTDAELITVWQACRTDDYGRIVQLLILTGQRRDEVGAIAKTELVARSWLIPGKRTKNGLAHEVPLSDLAAGILKQAIAREGRSGRDTIFGDGSGGFSGWSKAKAALDKRIEPKPAAWRVHDLRRTVATRMADLGVLPHVIEAILNHISGHKAGVAGVYNRALYSAEKRQALDLWAAHIEALLAGKPASNILPMKA
jgi:integrase